MKAQLRKELRARRRSLAPEEHAQRSKRAIMTITRLPQFKSGSRIAAYLPFDHETDTSALLAEARRRRVRIFVPVVTSMRARRIRFFPLTGETTRGAFGIAVPRRNVNPTSTRWFDLIVVPLVGIGSDGRRLGMGGGFYDRALKFRGVRRYWMGPRLVGLAFDCQRVDAAFADEWDIRLDALATESGINNFQRGQELPA